MRRLLAGVAIGALIFGVSFAGAKVATVTNPMSADLNGGGHNIQSVNSIHAWQGFYNDVLLGDEQTPGYPGFLDFANGSGDNHFISVRAGVSSPVGLGTPGLYIQQTGIGSVALWAKTGPDGEDWTCIAGCA